MKKGVDIKYQRRWAIVMPWMVCISAALFFFYQFMQMSALNSISSNFIEAFALTNIQLGKFSAIYLWGLSLFFFPAGLLLDRFSTRKLMLLAMALSICSTVQLAQTHSLFVAEIARFILGMSHAVAFLGCFRLASLWLPNRLALIMGLIITTGLLGGMMAQMPLEFLTKTLGWRNAILVCGALGVIIWIVLWIFVQDHPQNKMNDIGEKSRGLFMSIKSVICNLQNWICSLYTCLLNLPIILLGALWGDLYLTHTNHLTSLQASTIATMLYLGTVIGSPLLGWISDKFSQRKLFMILGALFSLCTILVIALTPDLSFHMLLASFLMIGILTSVQTLSYPIITENNRKEFTSTAMGFASILIMGGGAVFQPIFGWLIQRNWTQFIPIHNYRAAFLLLPIAFAISLFLSFFIQENNCKLIN